MNFADLAETLDPQIKTDVFGIDNREDSQITIPKDSYEFIWFKLKINQHVL